MRFFHKRFKRFSLCTYAYMQSDIGICQTEKTHTVCSSCGYPNMGGKRIYSIMRSILKIWMYTVRIIRNCKKTLSVGMKILREKVGKIQWFEFLPGHPEGRLESRGFSGLASLVPVTMGPIPGPHSFPLKWKIRGTSLSFMDKNPILLWKSEPSINSLNTTEPTLYGQIGLLVRN